MAELLKILQKEEEQKQAVESARKQAQTELGKKKQAFSDELEMAGITKEQENKVLEYKKKQTSQIRKTTEENFETQLKELKRKEQVNSNKAVEYVVKSLFME